MKNNFDIAKNIKSIENLKLNILNSTASLFTNFNQDVTGEELLDDICNILISGYLLSERLGNDFKDTDEEIIKKLKLQSINMLDETGYNVNDLEKYLKKRGKE
ncbi:MAG: MazG-like family protein [Thermoanaerobacteraceae bacterium]